MEKGLEREVRERAAQRCEYCQMPEALSELRYVMDHVVARQHAGETISSNLALACGRCNRYKGPNIAGIDPETRTMTRLFNPRIDTWPAHFRWEGPRLIGLTTIGRATIEVLAINHPHRVSVRRALIAAGKLRPA